MKTERVPEKVGTMLGVLGMPYSNHTQPQAICMEMSG